jgi:hypothetical protein
MNKLLAWLLVLALVGIVIALPALIATVVINLLAASFGSPFHISFWQVFGILWLLGFLGRLLRGK